MKNGSRNRKKMKKSVNTVKIEIVPCVGFVKTGRKDGEQMKCRFIGRPKHVYPCSDCKNQHCEDTTGHGNIPTTCHDCRQYSEKENGRSNCKRGIRPCKDFECGKGR